MAKFCQRHNRICKHWRSLTPRAHDKGNATNANRWADCSTERSKMAYINVLLPIRVPEGEYCWNYDNGPICENFDNEGGHASCELQLGTLKETQAGVLKPAKCLSCKAAQPSVQADGDFWTCPECNDSNHKDLPVCGGCETPRRN